VGLWKAHEQINNVTKKLKANLALIILDSVTWANTTQQQPRTTGDDCKKSGSAESAGANCSAACCS